MALLVCAIWTGQALAMPATTEQPLPRLLSDTGLYSNGPNGAIADGLLAFSPQYPLWSDGASKRRWIYLPANSHIDASRADAWEFPVGTRLWKEFSLGRRLETRMIDRLADGSWRYAAYAWREDGSDAELAPVSGIAKLVLNDGEADALEYSIPSEGDCRACHEGNAVPVLGFSALQLSPDRDPLAPHAEPPASDPVDLPRLVQRGLLQNLPTALLAQAPRIDAPSADARAALGYLHSNCGHCHNDPEQSGAGVPVDLLLFQSVERADANAAILRSLTDTTSRFGAAGNTPSTPIELLPLRMGSRDPRVQMPPLGSRIPDSHSLSLIQRWITTGLTKEITP